MPRLSSRKSESSEIELDGIAEQELFRLHQEYRIMEGDRKAYNEESQNMLRRQKAAIDALQAENEELMKDNKLAGSQKNENDDLKNFEHLSGLLNKEDDMKVHINRLKDAISAYDAKIQQTERKISKQRKNMGGAHMSQAKQVALQKHIRVLENRLDEASTKFNKSLAENKDLRTEIDHMRTERMVFQNLFKKLDKNLNDNKDEIAKVIEASTSSYDSRDDAQNKMIALKEKSDKEMLQYNMELKELLRIIDHDRKLKEFMLAKSEDRAEAFGLSLQYSLEREERDKGGEKEDAIQSYEAAFEQIKEATEIDDLNLLVGKFIETEDKNFALFNYVNQLNNEIEILQEQIADVEGNIERFKQDSVTADEQREKILKDLQENWKVKEKETEGFENVYRTVNGIVEQLREGIDSLFTKIDCDYSSIGDMLGGSAGVTNANIMQYLGMVEQRTNELIQVKAFINAKDLDSSERPESVGLLGKGPMPLPAAVTVHPPVTGDEYISDDTLQSEDENKPLTQQELRQRIMKGLSKREDSKKEKQDPSHETTFEEKMPKKQTKKSPMKER